MTSILKQSTKFTPGKLYPLDEIRRQTAFFKTKVDLPTGAGLFHLYAHRVDGTRWIGGPFAGPDSNFFLFLGVPKSQDDLRAAMAKIRGARPLAPKNDGDLWGPGCGAALTDHLNLSSSGSGEWLGSSG